VRFAGNRVAEGIAKLRSSGLEFQAAADMNEAADLAVAAGA